MVVSLGAYLHTQALGLRGGSHAFPFLQTQAIAVFVEDLVPSHVSGLKPLAFEGFSCLPCLRTQAFDL